MVDAPRLAQIVVESTLSPPLIKQKGDGDRNGEEEGSAYDDKQTSHQCPKIKGLNRNS